MHDIWPNLKIKLRKPIHQLLHNSLPKLTILTDTPSNYSS